MNASAGNDLASRIADLAIQSGLEVIKRHRLPGRNGTFSGVPTGLHPRVQDWLRIRHERGLYSHQARGIEEYLRGNDICIATPTASGKTLVFTAATVDLLLKDGSATVLALYPARALIQDQLGKWRGLLEKFKLESEYIDGGVSTGARTDILARCRVVLMTPDVAHAWMMNHLREPEVGAFLRRLKLLILDEAHVYDGVFGTNMAYFLRRLEVAAGGRYQVICSTATLGEPSKFMHLLTGRRPITLGPQNDGSPMPSKTFLLTKPLSSKGFDSLVELLSRLAELERGPFLAFADSRRMVEQLVAAIRRFHASEGDSPTEEKSANSEEWDGFAQRGRKDAEANDILPYRAGYETEDRNVIQDALSQGHLAGVVATSALELGLDIGEINVIILLNLPPSVKAFWQRVGRGGRRAPGVCVLVDRRGNLATTPGAFEKYLVRDLEPNWLYLDNRYIQYANALCAASEVIQLGLASNFLPFRSLPEDFRSALENELNPTKYVPPDLYPLKQRAQAGPHQEFPLRSAMEQNFDVRDARGAPLGTLTFSQALREAYPGAIYYYMARSYRVYSFNYRDGEILVKREKRWTTKPISQSMVWLFSRKCTGWGVRA